MSTFQRFAAITCFLLIGSCGWAGLIYWLNPQGAPLWGFFFGIAWWEAGKLIWPRKSEVLPLLESAVAWRVPVIVDCGEQPVGIPTSKKEELI